MARRNPPPPSDAYEVARAAYDDLAARRRALKSAWACPIVNPRQSCGCSQHREFGRLEAEAARIEEETAVSPLMLLLASAHPGTFAPRRP
jgi:hypothetical protein